MIAILSPAKSLDFASPVPELAATRPRLADVAEMLAARAAKLSKRRLTELMDISDKLAALNVDRFRGFAEAPERPALFAFAGDVYIGFDARSLEPEAIAYAQDHVRLLSGLYGLLRPLDAIRPYRLEMGTRWAPGRTRDLYAHWGDRIAGALAEDAATAGDGVVVNLASQEYWRAVEGRLPGDIRVIDVRFVELRGGEEVFVSFHAKRARGMMARWICEHRHSDPDALSGFDSDGYRFDSAGSTADQLKFVRG